MFTAKESFKAVLGSSTGIVFGGGGGVVLPQKIFVDVRASRFKKDGTRVVVADGQIFDLGIANTITITPVEVTGGYRFGRPRDSLRPYAGGGISWYRYAESDAFATADGGGQRDIHRLPCCSAGPNSEFTSISGSPVKWHGLAGAGCAGPATRQRWDCVRRNRSRRHDVPRQAGHRPLGRWRSPPSLPAGCSRRSAGSPADAWRPTGTSPDSPDRPALTGQSAVSFASAAIQRLPAIASSARAGAWAGMDATCT